MFFDKLAKIIKKPDPKKEEELRADIERAGGVGKKDGFAMIFSAYLVFIPIALFVLGIIALIAWLFLRG